MPVFAGFLYPAQAAPMNLGGSRQNGLVMFRCAEIDPFFKNEPISAGILLSEAC